MMDIIFSSIAKDAYWEFINATCNAAVVIFWCIGNFSILMDIRISCSTWLPRRPVDKINYKLAMVWKSSPNGFVRILLIISPFMPPPPPSSLFSLFCILVKVSCLGVFLCRRLLMCSHRLCLVISKGIEISGQIFESCLWVCNVLAALDWFSVLDAFLYI